jgi:hypothetical protein
MRRSRGGRPSKGGKRTPTGRLSRAGKQNERGEPNQHVVAVRHAFRWFVDGKATEHLFDPLGRAWATGLLDGHGIESKRLRDAGRDYGELYWGEYGRTGIATGGLERRSRTSGGNSDPDAPDRAGWRFAALDALLDGAGRSARDALHNLVVDHHWFPDEDPAWLARLITERRVAEWSKRKGRGELVGPAIVGELATATDHSRLQLAITALVALIPATNQEPATKTPAPSLAELTRPEDCAAPVDRGHAAAPVDPAFLDKRGLMRPSAEIADIIRERHAAGQGATK